MKAAARTELSAVWITCGIDGTFLFLASGKSNRGCSWSVQSILGRGLIPGGKESDKARQAVFFTPLNPCGENPDEENPLMFTQFLRKCIIIVIKNGIRMPLKG